MGSQSADIAQGHEAVIIDNCALAAAFNFGIDFLGHTEQVEALIYEMAAEIEKQTAAVSLRRVLPPGAGKCRTIAFESRFKAGDGPELAGGDQAFDREKVTVPAPVVKDS